MATLIFPGTRGGRTSSQGSYSRKHIFPAKIIATDYERCFPHFESAKESNATHGGSELMLATGSSYWAGIARDTLCLANEAADVAADL